MPVEQLVQLGGTHAALRLVMQLVRDAGPQTPVNPGRPDPFTHDLLWLLAHLAQRGESLLNIIGDRHELTPSKNAPHMC